jgi:soluble lytic murein transglycosylase-like protein
MNKPFVNTAVLYLCVFGLLYGGIWLKPRLNEANASYESITTHNIRQDNLAGYIMRLQRQERWQEADTSLALLEDTHPLKAYVEAYRYMTPGSPAPAEEKAAWLQKHQSLPVAMMVDRPAAVAATIKPSDILFNASRPKGWKDAISSFADGHYALAGEQFEAVAARSSLPLWYRSAARYWQARSMEQQGLDAEDIYARAARQSHTLYGMLAQQRLKQQRQQAEDLGGDQPKMLSDAQFQQLMVRVILLKRFEELDFLRNELDSMVPRLNDDQVNVLLDVASEYEIDVDTILRSRYVHAVSGYQVPDWFPYDAIRMDQALILGIVRQESRFNPQAHNPHSGATGLMQLMPQTARYIVNRYQLDQVKLASLQPVQIAPVTANRIRDPKANLIIGQHYLSYLSQKSYINNSLIHTLAAYNAGPANLISWEKRYENVSDPLLFMELIPFKETRQYVAQVMANQLYYQKLMGQDSDTAQALISGVWPQIKPL